jgi:predicted DNA-binding transcriptional regulator AlpA
MSRTIAAAASPSHGPIAPPVDKGRLLTAEQVAQELMSGTVSAGWVRRQVPFKVVLGHSTVRWFEHDVQAWLIAQRRSSN